MRRFFVADVVEDKIKIDGSDAHHIRRVLRYKLGDKLIVVDGSGKVMEAFIIEISDEMVIAEVKEVLDNNTESPIELILAQCLPKGDKMELVVQKAVELGVSTIYPIVSENCVVKYDEKKKMARQIKWQKIADEAAKQCGRTILPTVESVTELKIFLENIDSNLEALMCYEGEAEEPIKKILAESLANRFLVLIGPEGGFTKNEVEICQKAGLKIATLGKRILRTETAAIAASAIVMYEKGDLGAMMKG
ncbi:MULTISPECIES: 16S rRNA (uracil(1498)-N(3))-methyltransferase [Anaerosinus]|uniref:Ribosomal RNA small subunit methyltransferase E n=1 Tax=Selenobaculum gibii TaxID=3054208 RepID=A0A9Y2AHB3_9FIRM|nr:16S rRNA (uracil(1498)-N(3))-methyltransferase [Selenobaculum gbiensis]WIW69771.1 16S rRNA (uracil(1498)-N(3))-methyltransferase [Selenobaculum gbiensis]